MTRLPSLVALALLLLAGPAVAQTAPGTSSPGTPRVEGVPGGVRVEGVPEAGPAGGGQAAGPDLRPLWSAVNAGRLDIADRVLERYRQNFPGWSPPPELSAALDRLRLSAQLEAAKAASDWPAVVALAERFPQAFRCPGAGNVWVLADALAAQGRRDALRDLYRHVVATCTDVEERLYAIERALGELGPDAAEALIASEQGRGGDASVQSRLADLRARADRQRLEAGFERGDTAAAADLALRLREPGAAIRLGYQFLKLGDTASARLWFDRAVEWGGGGEAALGAANAALAAGDVEAARRFADSLDPADERVAELRRRLAGSALETALARRDLATADRMVRRLEQPGPAIRLGWLLFEAKRLAEAEQMFVLAHGWGGGEEALLGASTAALEQGAADRSEKYLDQIGKDSGKRSDLGARIKLARARTALAEGRLEEAERLAGAAAAQSPRSAAAARGVEDEARLRLASAALDADDPARALELAERAGRSPELRRGAAAIAAWAAYRLGRYDDAAARFEALYREDPEPAIAEGLYLSLSRAGEEERLAALSKDLGGPLADQIVAGLAQRDFDRDQFLLAYRIAPEARPGLAGIDGPWAQAGTLVRLTDGAAGRDRFHGITPYVAAGITSGLSRWRARIEYTAVDVGRPNPGDPVGTPVSAGAPFDPTTGAGFVVPSLSWTREGTWQPFADLGTTPIGGAVSPLPVGRLGVVRHAGDGGRWLAEAFGQSRSDSLLALAGIDDPATGDPYGRVIEAGLRLQLLQPLAPGWTLSGDALGSHLSGKGVDGNTHVRVGFAVSYDLGIDGFEYLAIGPSGRFEAYGSNENFYTRGHGGYFSPETFYRGGIDLNLQTEELARLVVRGSASVGIEHFAEADAAVVPGDPSQGRFSGSVTTGVAASFKAELAYLLSPHWQLGGFVGAARASNYTEVLAGIALRFALDGRTALVSRDIYPSQLEFSQR